MNKLLNRTIRVGGRRPVLTLVVWVSALVLIVLLAGKYGSGGSGEVSVNGSDSAAAKTLLDNFDDEGAGGSVIVYSGAGLDSKASKRAIEEARRRVEGLDFVTGTTDPFAKQTATISRDRGTALVTVRTDLPEDGIDREQAADLLDAAQPGGTEIQADLAGDAGEKLSRQSSRRSELIGIGVALVILTVALGALTAALIPVAIALASLIASLSIIHLLGSVALVPNAAETLASMLGIGVAIDYALFALARHRANLMGGMKPEESIPEAMSSSAGSIVLAGASVAVALGALSLAGIEIVTALGYCAAISVVVSVVTVLVTLPALMRLLGPRIVRGSDRGEGDERSRRRWSSWGRLATGHPFICGGAALLVLVLLSLPTLGMNLGQVDPTLQPSSTTAGRAADAIAEGFGPGANAELKLVAEPNGGGRPTSEEVKALRAKATGQPGVESVGEPTFSDSGEVALDVIPRTGPSDERTGETLDGLRSISMPGMSLHVGGQTASQLDLAERIERQLPLIILVVVAFSLVTITVAFRSLALALKAAVMNLLSIGASLGVLTLVFQEGNGAGLIGLDGAMPIVSFVPMIIFAIVFGLSTDYEVFLLSRVRERHLEGLDDGRAIAGGLVETGRVITAAALIMVAVFLSFAFNPDPVTKMFGVGLAAAIAIDATIVRCLLVPSTMAVLGRWNWWLPGWLDRLLPDIRLDRPPTNERRA